MRVNEHTGTLLCDVYVRVFVLTPHIAISTDQVVLVPYEEHHVPKYHEWMQDEELREATASEPLALDEEYAMQRSWRNDPDKLTFIACLPGEIDKPENMIGDVNLFLHIDGEDAGDDEINAPDQGHIIGELEIMVARRDLHGRGYGRAILLTFIWYILMQVHSILQEFKDCAPGTVPLGLKALRVRIGAANGRSIKLFESLGFKKNAESPNYFEEWELQWQHGIVEREEIMQRVKSHVGAPMLRIYKAGPNRQCNGI